MALLDWQEIFETGIELVDTQHQRLIGIINDLDALSNGDQAATQEIVDKALTELLAYTIYHFSAEEAFMREIAYSELEEHIKLHEQLTSHIRSFMSRIGDGAEVGCGELLRFLSDWVVKHIMGEDTKISREYAARSDPQSAG